MQKQIIKIFRKEGTFEPVHDFGHLRACADKVINQGVKMGEGWLIPAEMAALAETGSAEYRLRTAVRVSAQPYSGARAQCAR